MRNVQMFIVSEVKICKQCLQTTSASGGDPMGHSSPTPNENFWRRPLSNWTSAVTLFCQLRFYNTSGSKLAYYVVLCVYMFLVPGEKMMTICTLLLAVILRATLFCVCSSDLERTELPEDIS